MTRYGTRTEVSRRWLFDSVRAMLVMALLVPLAASCRSDSALSADTVRLQRYTHAVTGSGTIEPRDPVYVNAGASGPLASVNVTEGQHVEAGAVLASFDRGALEDQLQKAQANYLTEASLGDLMSSMYANVSSLYGLLDSTLAAVDGQRRSLLTLAGQYSDQLQSLVPQLPPELQGKVQQSITSIRQQVETLVNGNPLPSGAGATGYPESAAQADAARTEVAKREYDRAADALSRADLVAPVSGDVLFVPMGGLVPQDLLSGLTSGQGGFTSTLETLSGGMDKAIRELDVGSLLPQFETRPGTQVKEGNPVFMLVNPDAMQVRLLVDEQDVSQVQAGQQAGLTVDALPGRRFTGKVLSVSGRPALGLGNTVQYEVVVSLDAAGAPLKTGYSAAADVTTVDRQAVLLPAAAVFMDPTPHVYVMARGGARQRRVTLGLEDAGRVEVTGGLAPGERVVTRGAAKLERQKSGGAGR